VKRGANGKNPLQPSLDHIVPLSCGGTHTRDNVRCSHLRCNLLRKNRGAAQTRMALVAS
jgi:5-methylcytosine-specific restriction endonuclease McrA